MFQFAAVLGMSNRTGYDIAIPHHETYFDVNYECVNTSIFDGFEITVPTLDLGIINFNQVEFPFEYIDQKVNDFTDMVGYFQSEKYFGGADEEIKKQFTIKPKFKEVVDQKIAEGVYPDPAQCASLHIRLGDYTKKRLYHPAQPSRYWVQAVEAAGYLENVIIFSDDIDMAKQMFGKDKKLVYSQEDNPFTALYHMSLCRNHIICNSTFGWWGAKLGEWNSSIDKVIVAPKLWFGPKHNYDSSDIIPERWKLL